jgi:pilus assembly protein CpaF
VRHLEETMSLLSRLDRVRGKDASLDKNEGAPEGAEGAEELQALPPGEEGGARQLAAPREGGSRSSHIISTMQGVDSFEAVPENEDEIRRYFRHKHMIFNEVLSAVDQRLWQQPQRELIRNILEKAIDKAISAASLTITRHERTWLVTEFVHEVADFGPLTAFLEDPAITKIMVEGSSEVVIDRLGQNETSPVSFRDNDHLLGLIHRIAGIVGSRLDPKVPLLDRPLPDGGRVRAKVPPLSPHPSLSIEKTTGNPFEALRRAQAEQSRPESTPFGALRERIQQKLIQELDRSVMASGNPDQMRGQVEEMINQVIHEERIAMSRAERASLVVELIHEIVGLGPLEPLLNDPEVDEIMVNGPHSIYVERQGKLTMTNQRFRDHQHVMQIVERIIAPLGRRVDEKSPYVDGRLRDGSRFHAIIPPLALSGPTLTIRKFAKDPFTMTDLINFATITREAAQFLQAAVEARLNIVVSGGTGSGKTTTLNVLSSFIPSNERIVTIEDAAELQLRQDHVVRLETRPPNIEGAGEITIRDLVRNSLRMRPDRIVVGECRGAEALDMLQAMNTGHDGSLTTGHSNSPRDMIKRLETMVMMAGFDLPVRAIREQIAMAVDLVVHQSRMKDGTRKITAITEIAGMEGDVITTQDVFLFEQEYIDDAGKIHGRLQPTGLHPKCYNQILHAGVKLPSEVFIPRAFTEAVTPKARIMGGR